jgi:hypothetical protein
MCVFSDLHLQFLHFQVSGKAGVQAQLIVQSQKALPTTMTVQQIQQVIKHVQPQHIAHVSHVEFQHITLVLKIQWNPNLVFPHLVNSHI